MTETIDENDGPFGSGVFDRDAVRAKYLAERDKRLWEGRADIRDLAGGDEFANYRDDPFTPFLERPAVDEDADVVIIGAGLAGICVGAQLRLAGVENICMIDEAGGFGGTWYWNRYPELMCDVESYIYLPMLEELDYMPTRKYVSGEEIRQHLLAIVGKYDLAGEARLHTRSESSTWDEELARWVIRTDRGDTIRARHLVLATGILNLMKLPTIPGMADFEGRSFHTARWDYEYTGGGQKEKLHKLEGKTVGVIGTGASAIQSLRPLSESAKQVYVLQRTPNAIGVRGDCPTPPDFCETLEPGWQKKRMDNFQAVILGLPVEADLVDDGWTRDFARTRRLQRDPSWSPREYGQRIEEVDFEIMEEHRTRVGDLVHDADTAAALKPYFRYMCKRPLFHDEFLQAFNNPNVTLIDCSGGIERVTDRGVLVNGEELELDCIIYATGFEAEMTPLPRRVNHNVIGSGGVTLAEKWADGSASLWGMASSGFPNMFIMPAPGQQAVVTVNYTHLAMEGAEHIAQTVALLKDQNVEWCDVTPEAENAWCQSIIDTWIDGTAAMADCTPSRINNEGRPEDMRPRDGNWGGGFGDFFGYRQLLADWRNAGDFAGFEVHAVPAER